MSGYVPCACRDCMDIAISGDDGRPALCGECEEAGCIRHSERPGFLVGHEECQRIDMYEES